MVAYVTDDMMQDGGGVPAAADQHLLAAEGTVVAACTHAAGDVMATASSDAGVVQIWAAAEQGWRLVHTEKLPAQPTQLAWAHPEYGHTLAIGTSRGQVHIIQRSSAASTGQAQPQHQQQQQHTWSSSTQFQCDTGAITALAFAPHQHGLVLAAACSRRQPPVAAAGGIKSSSGGCLQLWEAGGRASTGQWTLVSQCELREGAGSCHCLSWHQATPGLPPMLLGGHKAGGSIWCYRAASMMWQELCTFTAPDAAAATPALSVHWAPALGRPYELVAASFGRTVTLFKLQPAAHSGAAATSAEQQLEAVPLQQLQHPLPVWKCEFNSMGTTLACSLDGKPEVWLWMPGLTGSWAPVNKIGQQPAAAADGQQQQGMYEQGLLVD